MLCCCSQLESVGADRRRDAPRGSSSFSTNFASTGRVLLRYQPSPFHSCHGADGWWGGWGDGGIRGLDAMRWGVWAWVGGWAMGGICAGQGGRADSEGWMQRTREQVGE